MRTKRFITFLDVNNIIVNLNEAFCFLFLLHEIHYH